MKRLRKALLSVRRAGEPAPVTLIGTRFEESAGRAARMLGRGETDVEPWE